ncbi:MAG: hypothetical protein WCP93_00920 [Candidatus Berkelbacteria bacterium]
MKNIFSLGMALILALILTLTTAGCDGGNAKKLSPSVPNYQITVSAPNDSAQKVNQDFDGTGFTAYTGHLYFDLIVAGTRGGAPSADFQLWKSSEPQNWNSPSDDLKTFTKVCDLAYENGELPNYWFFEPGRYLIKAFALNSKVEYTHTRLTINKKPVVVPVIVTPHLSIKMSASAPNEIGDKTVTIVVKNNGVTADNITVSVFDYFDTPGSIIVYAGQNGLQDWLTDSGPVEIGYGMIFKPGTVKMTKSGMTNPITDDIITDVYNAGIMSTGEEITFTCIYTFDQNAPGKGMTRKIKRIKL